MDQVSKERFPDPRELIAERFNIETDFPPELGGGPMPTHILRCDCTEEDHPCSYCEGAR